MYQEEAYGKILFETLTISEIAGGGAELWGDWNFGLLQLS